MGAAGTDNFCLRWNDFADNVSGAFKDLRAESDFFDVTLACSDSGQRTLQAHKVILSACSNFFKGMLRQQSGAHKHPNPYIYLRGVSYNDLISILDFIYNGEVNVAQEDLNSFLAVAEELQIKGLTNREGTSQSEQSQQSRKSSGAGSRPRVPEPAAKKARRSSPAPTPSIRNDDDDEVKAINIKDDPEAVASTSSAVVNPDDSVGQDFDGAGGATAGADDYDESYDGYYEDDGADMNEGGEEADGTKESEEKAMQYIRTVSDENGRRMFRCEICQMESQHFYSVRRHMVTKHTRPSKHRCCYCAKVFPYAIYLERHLSRTCLKKVFAQKPSVKKEKE